MKKRKEYFKIACIFYKCIKRPIRILIIIKFYTVTKEEAENHKTISRMARDEI